MPNPSRSPTSAAVAAQLAAALELAANEMRAAQTVGTLPEIKNHTEAAVNILVGKYGRWYGDQDGDGKTTDPSDGRGVLPGEKSPASGGADGDTPPQFPYGLALLSAGQTPNIPPIAALLGDVTLWRTKPRGGYDSIANAIAGGSITRLQGRVPRAVAFGRLLLTGAQTPDAAHALADSAASELDIALETARAMAK